MSFKMFSFLLKTFVFKCLSSKCLFQSVSWNFEPHCLLEFWTPRSRNRVPRLTLWWFSFVAMWCEQWKMHFWRLKCRIDGKIGYLVCYPWIWLGPGHPTFQELCPYSSLICTSVGHDSGLGSEQGWQETLVEWNQKGHGLWMNMIRAEMNTRWILSWHP